MAFISPANIIEGMIQILEANIEPINDALHHYHHGDKLNIFKGLRRTMPQSAFPCLELEPESSGSDWMTTSAQDSTYDIRCVLTLNCQNDELGAEYISEITRRIVQIFNYPPNMAYIIPNEYQGKDKEAVWAQYGYISSVSYGATKDLSIRQADWTYSCKVIETYDYWNLTNGPLLMDFKEDILRND